MDSAEKIRIAHEVCDTREDKTKYYDSWAAQYDKDLSEHDYRGPDIIADVLATIYPTRRDAVYILDVAAGTGLVGAKLAERGFTKLDALDPSKGMLQEAKAKGIYRNMICAYIDENELEIKADTYDVITICGSLTNSHIPCSALREIIRLVKPGGYFVAIALPYHFDTDEEYKGKFLPLVDTLETNGKWRKIRQELVPGYYRGEDGLIFVYQIKG